MKSAAPSLLPILRSRALGDIVTWLALHPEEDFALKDLAAHARTSPATATREVNNLARGGLIDERRSGNQRRVSIRQDTAIFAPLQRLLIASFGPKPVLEELLSPVDGIVEAYIYGSWAARSLGVPGPVPHDVDVLVVGRVSSQDADQAVSTAQSRLGRAVSIHQVRPERWSDDAEPDAFIATVRERPMVKLELEQAS